jgi:hypothetical protein
LACREIELEPVFREDQQAHWLKHQVLQQLECVKVKDLGERMSPCELILLIRLDVMDPCGEGRGPTCGPAAQELELPYNLV